MRFKEYFFKNSLLMTAILVLGISGAAYFYTQHEDEMALIPPNYLTASLLTSTQVSSVINLLKTVGASQSIIDNVTRALYGGTPVTPIPQGVIAYTVKGNGENFIYTMNADGTGATQIASCGNGECIPSWSFDRKKITFTRSDNDIGVFIMNADGTNLRRLSPVGSRDVTPSFSPDGTKIIFTHKLAEDPGGGVPTTELMTMNAADGSNRTIIIPAPAGGGFSVEAHYSPDGTKILFMRGLPGIGQHVYVSNADGTGIKQLTNTGTNGDPNWSPDGGRISFGSNREGGGKLNIFTMKADGSDVKQITHFLPPYESGDTSWSPDGKYITFEWDVDGKGQSDPNAKAEVWTVSSDGSGQPASTGRACAAVGCAPRWRP